MKKFICFLVILFTFNLYACDNTTKEIKYEIEIFDNVRINNNDLENYDWSHTIFLSENGTYVTYKDFTVTPIGEIILETYNDFLVTITYNNKTISKQVSFYVYNGDMIDIVIYNKNELTTYRVNSNEGLNLNDIVNFSQDNFLGWYYDKNYNSKYSSTVVTTPVTLYAKWSNSARNINTTTNRDISSNMLQYIDTLIENTPSYIPAWNKEGFKGRWNYIDGVFLRSLIDLYYETDNDKYKDFFLRYIDYYIDDYGKFINPETGDYSFRENELDSICESNVLFDAYELTNNSKYYNAILTTYEYLTRMEKTSNNINYSHKSSYPNQIWLDGMYMYVPFYVKYANLTNDLTLLDNIKAQYQYIKDNMYDTSKHLYYHGHDTTKSIFWADSNTGNSSNFWLRSNGWYITSLVDCIQYFPEGDNKSYLKNLLSEAITGILEYKDETYNMFYQLIDKGNAGYYVNKSYLSNLDSNTDSEYVYMYNYLESSGSSMIAYSILKAVRLELLDSTYLQTGLDIFKGVYNHSFINGELNDICITAGLGPYNNLKRDGSVDYYLSEKVGSSDAKGVGPFIMAYIEFYKTLEA